MAARDDDGSLHTLWYSAKNIHIRFSLHQRAKRFLPVKSDSPHSSKDQWASVH